jgi:hypothetical protein
MIDCALPLRYEMPKGTNEILKKDLEHETFVLFYKLQESNLPYCLLLGNHNRKYII